MGKNINQLFLLDSKGLCFLCLNKITTVKHELGSVQPPPPPLPKYSVYYLSRYLKMNMRKLFNNKNQLSSELPAKLESPRLMVELCEDCVHLMDQFSENYRQLEKAEMQLKSCLRLIHEKFIDASVTIAGKPDEFKKLTDVQSQLMGSSTEELEIMEVLREEAFHKSHHKLRTSLPRVHLQNLTTKKVTAEKLKFRTNADKQQKMFLPASTISGPSSLQLGTTDISDIDIKMELYNPDAYFLSDDDNGNSPPSDDQNLYNEAMINYDVEDTQFNVEENKINDKPLKKGIYPSPATRSRSATKIQCKPKAEVKKSMSIFIPETGKHKCCICSFEYATKVGFQRHYKSVHLKVKFKCVTCGKQFNNQSACYAHRKSAHGGVRYACTVCRRSFSQKGSVRKHQRVTNCGSKVWGFSQYFICVKVEGRIE